MRALAVLVLASSNVLAASPPLTSAEIESLVAALADDDVRYNAHEAMSALAWRGGAAAITPLQKALESPDPQQRAFAAVTLARLSPEQPSPRLLELLVDGLADNQHPRSPEVYNFIFDAADGSRYLVDHAVAATPYLVKGLYTGDPQQEFLCAFLLGQAGITDEIDRCARILLPHLRDNDIDNDACAAVHALYRLGPGVLPHLKAALGNADEQQRSLILLIARDLADPPRTRADFDARKAAHVKISSLWHDPAVEYEHDRKGFHWPPRTQPER